MELPLVFRLGPVGISAHFVFEVLAYAAGFQLYLILKKREGDTIPADGRWIVIAAAAVGAALGSRTLTWLSDLPLVGGEGGSFLHLLQGKTIVGALLGGLIGVEVTKPWVGIRRSTGDLFALPLVLGIAVGRVGCLLSGLADGTHGVATTLPWALDFGDGVLRHPVRLYEMLYLGALAAVLLRLRQRPRAAGDLFKAFMIGYLGFRLAVDFLKPGNAVAGLTLLQWACVAGLVYYVRFLPELVRRPEVPQRA